MEIQQYLSDTCPLRIHIPINNKKDNDFSMLNRYCEDSLCDRPNDSQPSFLISSAKWLHPLWATIIYAK